MDVVMHVVYQPSQTFWAIIAAVQAEVANGYIP